MDKDKTEGIVVAAGVGAPASIKKIEAVQKLMENKVRGFIVAAYPGMGQEVYLSIYDDYKILSLDDYNLESEDWAMKYAEDAIKMVTIYGFKICFVVPKKEILGALYYLNEAFLVVYPAIDKDKFLLRMFEMYSKIMSPKHAQEIADVIKDYDEDIKELKLYFNSVSSSTGIINEEVLNRFIEIQDLKKRKDILLAIGSLKDMKASAYKKSKKKTKRHKA